jgi:ATP-dependent protease HslVU (ClpYQ) peptidase subunit
MIVYYNNVIYLFETDYQIDEWAAQFEAIGSGSHYAIGAMTALLNLGNKYSADEIARIAIETSMKHDPNTGGHVFVEEL